MYETAWLSLVIAGLFLLPELVDWTLEQVIGTLSTGLKIRADSLKPRARWWSTVLMFVTLYWWSSAMGCLVMPWSPLHWASRTLCGLTALVLLASMMDLRGRALGFAVARARDPGHPWKR